MFVVAYDLIFCELMLWHARHLYYFALFDHVMPHVMVIMFANRVLLLANRVLLLRRENRAHDHDPLRVGKS